MKKSLKIVGTILFASFLFTSCGGNSIEKDAKKMAELQCKAKELVEKAASGDASVLEESTKLAAEAASLKEEIRGKYTSESDQKEFGEALLKEMGNCK